MRIGALSGSDDTAPRDPSGPVRLCNFPPVVRQGAKVSLLRFHFSFLGSPEPLADTSAVSFSRESSVGGDT